MLKKGHHIWLGLLLFAQLSLSEKVGPDILIMGSIVGNGPKNNVVLIKDLETSRVMALRVDHEVSGWTVVSIDDEQIRLKKGDQEIDVFKDRFRAPETVDKKIETKKSKSLAGLNSYSEDGFERVGGKIRVTSAYKDELLKNQLGKILMQSSVIPLVSNGRITGFEISRIEPGSIYEKIGLIDGDVITELNGIRLDNVARAVQLLKSMRGDAKATMKVRRGEEITTIDVSIE